MLEGPTVSEAQPAPVTPVTPPPLNAPSIVPQQVDAASTKVLGRRFVAFALDVILINLIQIPLLIPLLLLVGADALQGLDTVIGVAFMLVYFGVMEMLWGRSLGKMALGLRVVGLDGSTAISAKIAFGRSLLLIVDSLLLGLVGLVAILRSPLNQRVGDSQTKTVVVLASAVSG